MRVERIMGAGVRGVGVNVPEGVRIVINLARLNLPYTEDNVRKLPDLEKQLDDKSLSERKFSRDNLLSLFDMPATRSFPYFSKRVFLPVTTTAVYSPHLYFPQAVGIIIGRLAGRPFIALSYMGRFFNLIVWLGLVYLAIRSTPVLKWLFLVYALTPMSLFQSSSLSADSLTNGLAILLVAVCLRYAYGPKEETNLIILFALALAVAISKLYFQLVLLFLLLPQERVGSRKRYWGSFALLVMLSMLSVFLIRLYMQPIYVPIMPSVSPPDQLKFVVDHPLHYLSVIGRNLADKWDYYLITFVGSFGHYFLHHLPLWLAAIHMTVLISVAFSDNGRGAVITLKDRAVLCALFLLGALWFFTAQYLIWNPVGSSLLEGVQGRYFVPIVLPLLVAIRGRRGTFGIYRQQIHAAIICYVLLILSYSTYVIVQGYYA